MDLLINTSLNYMSIRSRLVTQPRNKPVSNSEKLFNTTDLSPITFDVVLPLNPSGKISTNSQIDHGTSGENKHSKVCTIKILLDSGASA